MKDVPGKAWPEGGVWHVDTSGLPPPEPMVAILWHVENTPGPIIAHMDRNPVHLYPELAERGWKVERTGDSPDGILLMLRPIR